MDYDFLEQRSRYLRDKSLQTAWFGQAGHITSSLSMLDILTVLYFGGILNYCPQNADWEGRDRFILSKAHGGLGYYVVLAETGYFPKEELKKYCHTGQHLGDISNYAVTGVENTGGSLGHGLPFAVGKALAARMRGEKYLTYVLTGDGECQEGVIWETALFIASKKLNNLIWIIDRNELQANGRVEKMVSLESLTSKLEAFNFETKTVDGHNHEQLMEALSIDRENLPERPRVVIANTIKGKGVPLFEGKEGWHGRTPTREEYSMIMNQLGYTLEEFERL